MLKQLLLLFFLFGSVLQTHAASSNFEPLFENKIDNIEKNKSLNQLVENLAQTSIVRNAFTQKKKMAILKRPIISNGTMLFAKNYGLYWKVNAPFESTLVITDNKVMQKSGELVSIVSASEQPAMFEFAQIFFLVFSGDIKTLEKHFEIFYANESGSWRIGLLPKNKLLGKMLSHVVLQGNAKNDFARINSVYLRDVSGDETEIKFNTNTLPITLADITAAEQAYFDF